MLYSNNYFKKEIQQKYNDSKISLRYMFSYGIFLGLITFSLHFLLQTVYESVLTTRFPQFMSPSFHTVLYTYLDISCIFFLIYFLINYRYITFYEIHRNRWYLLKKLGYRSSLMTLSKLVATNVCVLFIYTTGFVTAILLTIFLKYTLIMNYFVTMYLIGLMNVLLLSTFILLGSLFIKESWTQKYYIASVGILLYFIERITNYFGLVRNRVLMQDVHNLFKVEQSPYLLICFSLIILGMILCVIFAISMSKNYHYVDKKRVRIRLQRGIDLLMYSLLTIFIVICASIQLIILGISFVSPEKEISIRGTIPYVFQSNTMENTIYKNDLVYFQKIDSQTPLALGDIVLFKEDTRVFVERVQSLHGDYVTVDIDNYPKDAKEGVMRKSIPRSSIYGRYRAKNRYLGALILFANTTFGRLIFLVLPSILLFFHSRIGKMIKKITKNAGLGGAL